MRTVVLKDGWTTCMLACNMIPSGECIYCNMISSGECVYTVECQPSYCPTIQCRPLWLGVTMPAGNTIWCGECINTIQRCTLSVSSVHSCVYQNPCSWTVLNGLLTHWKMVPRVGGLMVFMSCLHTWKSGLGPLLRSWSKAPIVIIPTTSRAWQCCLMWSYRLQHSDVGTPCFSVLNNLNVNI